MINEIRVMKMFKLSLGKEYFDDNAYKTLYEINLVCVHPNTPSIGQSNKSQGHLFLNAEKGDLFYVCRSNNSIEFIGMFKDDRPMYSSLKDKNDWTDREYIKLMDAVDSKDYDKTFKKWWTPKGVTTFHQIPEYELIDFENKILRSVFGISIEQLTSKQVEKQKKELKNIEYYANLQKHYTALLDDTEELFKEVNKLSSVELKKLEYTYLQRGDISDQPVVLLRYRLLENLIEGKEISNELIDRVKLEVDQNFEKNVFQSWGKPFRILYSFLYEKEKQDLVDFFYQLISNIQKEIQIEGKTKINLVHLDGAQNQGTNEIWFAIYNNTFKTQKFAKQLFFKVKNGFEYGLLDTQNRKLSDLKKADIFDYEDIIQTFSKHIKTILNDNSMEKAKIGEYIEILEHKKQIILQGPPGTGKTYSAKKIANQFIGENNKDKIKIVQFHPSYSYEDFVRGISAKNVDGKIAYQTENKVLAKFAQNALESKTPHVLIIDEINRANLPVVLGELIYALEYRGEAVETMYTLENGDNKITIPENLYIIGTMNTADRSVSHIDYAIKRRFAFVDVLPDEEPINNKNAKEIFKKVSDLFVKDKDGKKVNSEWLALDFNFKDVQLGHSYFILKDGTEEEQNSELSIRLKYEIMPILREYVKDGLLLESDNLNKKLEDIENFDL